VVVALAAPPVDGAANEELLAFLATSLGCAKSALRLVLGQTSKQKVVEISGFDAAEIASRIGAANTKR
jgi:uncharacterized protein YggU (UPF0235/DUF167 family)